MIIRVSCAGECGKVEFRRDEVVLGIDRRLQEATVSFICPKCDLLSIKTLDFFALRELYRQGEHFKAYDPPAEISDPIRHVATPLSEADIREMEMTAERIVGLRS